MIFVNFSVFTFPVVFFAFDPGDSLYCVVISRHESSAKVPGTSRLNCPVEFRRVGPDGSLIEVGA